MKTCPACQNDLVCHDQGECKQPPAPDYGEPWQIGIMGFPQAVTNSQGKIMAGNSAVARAVACVNACAGMADPAATIDAMREAIREAHDALSRLDDCRVFYADGMDIDNYTTDDCATARAKLQPFLEQ